MFYSIHFVRFVPANLYLDGHMPHTKLPVVVYIHGESYEWNSGNAYDGTILASYGQVIVVQLIIDSEF